jgi:hypothetical protein
MFIGRLKADPASLVVAIGPDFTEIDEANYTWTGTGRPPEGVAHRLPEALSGRAEIASLTVSRLANEHPTWAALTGGAH